MQKSTTKKVLIIGGSIFAILAVSSLLIVTSAVKGNEWFIQLTFDMLFQSDKSIQSRIDEWKPTLRSVQADNTPNRAYGITNTVAVTYPTNTAELAGILIT